MSRTGWFQEKDGEPVGIPSADTAGALRKRCLLGPGPRYLLREGRGKVIRDG